MLKDVVVVEGGSRCEEIIAHDPPKGDVSCWKGFLLAAPSCRWVRFSVARAHLSERLECHRAGVRLDKYAFHRIWVRAGPGTASPKKAESPFRSAAPSKARL